MDVVMERRHQLPPHRLPSSFLLRRHRPPFRNSTVTDMVNRQTPDNRPDLPDKRRKKERDTTNAKTTHPLGDGDAHLRGSL